MVDPESSLLRKSGDDGVVDLPAGSKVGAERLLQGQPNMPPPSTVRSAMPSAAAAC
jgi:hypothetical protein